MAVLLTELQEIVDAAQSGKTMPLHQTLIAEPGAGRVFHAGKYAKALVAKGIVGDWKQIDADAVQLPTGQKVSDLFKNTDDRAVIIDHLDRAPKSLRDDLVKEIVKAIDGGNTVIILTGERPLENFVNRDTELVSRLGVSIDIPEITAQQKADEEAEVQRINHVQAVRAAHEKERIQRIADWKDAKDEDLRPKSRISAPKTARFAKPEGVK